MRREHSTAAVSEFTVAGFALLALLVAQWSLTSAIHGSNYYGVDGKMAQATVLSTLTFGDPLNAGGRGLPKYALPELSPRLNSSIGAMPT